MQLESRGLEEQASEAERKSDGEDEEKALEHGAWDEELDAEGLGGGDRAAAWRRKTNSDSAVAPGFGSLGLPPLESAAEGDGGDNGGSEDELADADADADEDEEEGKGEGMALAESRDAGEKMAVLPPAAAAAGASVGLDSAQLGCTTKGGVERKPKGGEEQVTGFMFFHLAGILAEGSSGCVVLGEKAGEGEDANGGSGENSVELSAEAAAETLVVPRSSLVGEPADQVAIKVIKVDNSQHMCSEEAVAAELAVLRDACGTCPFLVKLHFSHRIGPTVHMGMEYCAGGDLFTLLSGGPLTPPDVLFFACEIMLALHHLHTNNVMHCDLKPENIALSADGHVRLIDFGLSIVLDPETSFNPETGLAEVLTRSGTLPYCAPEILTRAVHGFESDWWSFGVIVYEMLFGCLPWYTQNDQDTCIMICTSPLETPDAEVPDELCFHLLERLLTKQRQGRVGFTTGLVEIQEHPWFNNVDWDVVGAQGYESPFMLEA